jgi:uncharacterized membrane protein
MVLVTATAGALAVRRDALLVAVLGLVGGFLTPYLVSTGEDRPLSLFAYIALLDAGVVAVASRRRWPVLPLLGVAGSSLVYLGWSLKFLDASRAPFALIAAAALAAVFALTTPRAPGSSESPPTVVGRITASVAAVLPLVLALVVSGATALPVAPVVLVAYLAVLSAGAWFVGRRVDVPALAPIAAACGAVTLAVRVDAALFPAARLTTLAVFAVLPVAWFGLWLARRAAPEERMLRTAATIAIAASAVLVIAHVCVIEEGHSAVAPLAVYAWLHAALLGAIAVLAESSAFFVGALAVEAAALVALSTGAPTSRLGEYLPVVVLPMLAFWSLPLLGPAFRRGFGVWIASAVGLAIHFLVLYALAESSWGDGPLGACSVACGLLALGTLWVARTKVADPRVGVYALVGGIALSFFTAAVPILLSNEWLTIAWALEAAALAWLVRRVKHKGLLVAAALLGGATLVRLLVNPAVLEYHARSSTPILNWWLYTYGVAAAAFLVAWHLLRGDGTASRFKLPEAFAFAAGLLLFVLVNIEIADFYSTGSELTFQFSGGGFGQDMTYTLAWGFFALALLGLGVTIRSRSSRICAIVLVCITAAKGALHDVWALGSLYRVGAIVGLAFTLLGVSYLTQRFVLRKSEGL